MLVDSNYERRTFAELRRLQQWLHAKQRIRMEIEKPVLDIGSGENDLGPHMTGEPCIPDFILRTDTTPADGAPRVIVETMGFASDAYRSRKVVTHRIMQNTLNAPVLMHDFHFPTIESQPQRDRSFWLEARWAITGLVKTSVSLS